MYGKQTECAIAAMSRLAEAHGEGQTRLSAIEIADAIQFRRPTVSKILSILSRAGLVKGVPGPGGGFIIGRAPASITLYDVYALFEREEVERFCPFGGRICGDGDACPMHEKLTSVHEAMDRLLHESTFEEFRVARQKKNRSGE